MHCWRRRRRRQHYFSVNAKSLGCLRESPKGEEAPMMDLVLEFHSHVLTANLHLDITLTNAYRPGMMEKWKEFHRDWWGDFG